MKIGRVGRRSRIAVVGMVAILMAAACGGGEASVTSKPVPAATPMTSQTPPASTPRSTQRASPDFQTIVAISANGVVCENGQRIGAELVHDRVTDEMVFSADEIEMASMLANANVALPGVRLVEHVAVGDLERIAAVVPQLEAACKAAGAFIKLK